MRRDGRGTPWESRRGGSVLIRRPSEPVLAFASMTFARNGVATMHSIQDQALQSVAINTLRQDPWRTTPDGRPYYWLEGARTNLLLRSRDPGGTSWTAAGLTRTADDANGIDGTLAADRLAVGSGSQGTYQAVSVGSGAFTASVFGKKSAADNAVLHWYWGTGAAGATTFKSETLTASWQRFTATVSPGAGTRWVQGPDGIDRQAAGGYAAGAQDCYLDFYQLEAGSFATSPIVTVGSQVSRVIDDLYQAAGPATLNEPHRYYVRPRPASTELAANQVMTIIATGTSDVDRLVLRNSGGNTYASVYRGVEAVLDRAITWTADAELTIDLDPVQGTLTVAGAATGDGTATADPWTWSTSTECRVGAYTGGSNAFFGLVAEPWPL